MALILRFPSVSLFFFSSRRRHTICALVTGVQTCALPIFVERIDVALIGAGRMGQVHGPNAALHPGLRLKYVVDPRPGAAAPLCERFGAAAATLEQALADPGIGAVLVCSSTDKHLAHALAAVDAGDRKSGVEGKSVSGRVNLG